MPDATTDATPDAPADSTATVRKFRVRIAASPEAVWEEITRTDRQIPAFFNTRMDCHRFEPGAKLAMRSANGRWTGVVGEILEHEPPRRFAHTFKFTNYDDPECIVEYDLVPDGDGTTFTMTIRDLPVGTKTAKQMVQGGTMIVNTLKAVLETGRPGLGTRMLFVIFRLTAPLSPKRCRSENWPI